MNLREYIKSQENLLTIYFTAGYPELNDTEKVLKALDQSDAGLIEIGLPFSDSLVDGPTIQASNEQALANGMGLKLLFQQLKTIGTINTPFVLMGSINPVMRFGIDNFIKEAKSVGVSGVILPDLPPEEYEKHYKQAFEAAELAVCFLITVHTSDERIKYIDSLTTGFIYAVSSDAITGNQFAIDQKRKDFFQKLKTMNLKNPYLIGFGIRDHQSYLDACNNSNGAIIGSDFIRNLDKQKDLDSSIQDYCKNILQ